MTRKYTGFKYLLIMYFYTRLKSLLLVYFLIGVSLCGIAQQKLTIQNPSVRKELKAIFAHDDNLDSLQFIYNNKVLRGLKIFKKTDSNTLYYNQIELSKPLKIKHPSFYALYFEGDLFFLKKEFPLLYHFVNNHEVLDFVQVKNGKKNFKLAIGRKGIHLRNSDAGSVYALLDPSRGKEFVDQLNLNYRTPIPNLKDSILIIQAVLERSGRLGDHVLLYGASENFYEYFLKTYDHYIKENLPFDREPKYESLFRPFLSSGTPLRSLIDIYVRLNADNTFTVSTCGELRRLKIKDFKDNRDSPIVQF